MKAVDLAQCVAMVEQHQELSLKISQQRGELASETSAVLKTLEQNMSRHMKEREAQIHASLEAMSASIAVSISIPPRGGSGPGDFGDKVI